MTAFHPTCYRLLSKELSSLLEIVLTGEVIEDRAIAERIVRFLGASISLHERHEVDRYGRCTRCVAAVAAVAPTALVFSVFDARSASPSHSNSYCLQQWPRQASKVAVAMTRDDEELLLALSRISKDSGAFALGVLENNVSRDDQIDFGYRLVDLAEAIRERALRTAGLVAEGSVGDEDGAR